MLICYRLFCIAMHKSWLSNTFMQFCLLRYSVITISSEIIVVVCADSCVNMVIEDSYISVGDDGVAIKSGWDQYGIAYSRPSSNITIRNLIVRSMIR